MTKEIEGFVRQKGSRYYSANPEMGEAVWQATLASPKVWFKVETATKSRLYRKREALATLEAMKAEGLYPRPLPDGVPF